MRCPRCTCPHADPIPGQYDATGRQFKSCKQCGEVFAVDERKPITPAPSPPPPPRTE